MVIPAVDLLDGRAVRLAGGDRTRATVYSDEPWRLAEDFARAGASRIHVVDLDGAFAGGARQTELVGRLVDAAHRHGATVEVGGGVRDAETVATLIGRGADLVVLGTLAVERPDEARDLCGRHRGRVIVAVDARDGRVAIAGWQQDGGIEARTLAEHAADWGAAAVLYTDVARDGLQVGPAVESTVALQDGLSIPVIASGGVGSLADLHRLRDAGIRAVVLGRALYEGTVSLPEALSTC